MVMGREIRQPSDVMFRHVKDTHESDLNPSDYVNGVRERMHKAHEVARKHLEAAARRSKDVYDARLSFHHYEVGDAVWLLHETRRVGVSAKLEKAYDGPFVVKAKVSAVNFVIQMDSRGSDKLIHHNKLKPYRGSNLSKWIVTVKNKT
ncbi:uncharacterized protein LOC127878690 [Dreissena polymorpha]|uniref:uncharacterized protein LOC127878690 n=1 Tax=Dreissena polymorpha TaxID=45954 RepID=UPI002263D3E3|nr:uncharacterized protein LOC127878690 [Dreissena polymorpha]